MTIWTELDTAVNLTLGAAVRVSVIIGLFSVFDQVEHPRMAMKGTVLWEGTQQEKLEMITSTLDQAQLPVVYPTQWCSLEVCGRYVYMSLTLN